MCMSMDMCMCMCMCMHMYMCMDMCLLAGRVGGEPNESTALISGRESCSSCLV